NIYTTPLGRFENGLTPIFVMAVEGDISAEGTSLSQLFIIGASDVDGTGTRQTSNLAGSGVDPAPRSDDEHVFTSLQAAAFDERVPGGDVNQGRGRGLSKSNMIRQVKQVAGGYHRILSKKAG